MEASSTSREPCSRPSQDGTGHARGRERTAQQAEGSQSGPQPGGPVRVPALPTVDGPCSS